MKTQIRNSIFETNSSSTHVLCTIQKDDYNAWRNGELFYYPMNNHENNDFITAREAKFKKSFIKNEYRLKTKYPEDFNEDIFFLDELLEKGWPIIGFYPLSYKEYKKLNDFKYGKNEVDERDSNGIHFQKKGKGTHIAFNRWISEGC